MVKIILHIDLNAFFATCEQILDPSLLNKPIAVAGNKRHGVVTTASYEARKYKVNSAMPVSIAKSLCKDLIIVNSHYDFYEEMSEKFFEFLKTYSKIMEPASIDEAYLDVTDIIYKYEKPLDLVLEIQTNLYKKLKLPCSIGVATNKFLAKMASDMKKPMGITLIRNREVKEKLWPLDIKEMYGVGKVSVKKLREIGINTIGELACFKDKNLLRTVFKNQMEFVLNRCYGKDSNELNIDRNTKSISQSVTLVEDISEYSEIKGVLYNLSRNLYNRLKSENFVSKNMYLTIKYYDFNVITRFTILNKYICSLNDIFENILDIFDDNYNEEPIRLLGIGFNKLKKANEINQQIDIFSYNKETTRDVLNNLKKLLPGSNLCLMRDIIDEDK